MAFCKLQAVSHAIDQHNALSPPEEGTVGCQNAHCKACAWLSPVRCACLSLCKLDNLIPLLCKHRCSKAQDPCSPGPPPQMATLSPLPTSPSSFACQAVGKMSDSSTTFLSGRLLGTFSRFTSAARHNIHLQFDACLRSVYCSTSLDCTAYDLKQGTCKQSISKQERHFSRKG